jgi:hypothetical protein
MAWGSQKQNNSPVNKHKFCPAIYQSNRSCDRQGISGLKSDGFQMTAALSLAMTHLKYVNF